MKPSKVTGTGPNGRTLKRPSKYCTTSTDEGEILRRASRRENKSIKGCIKRMMGDADLEILNMQSDSKNGKSASANKRAQLIHTSASTSTKTTPNLESSQSSKSKSLHFPKSDLTHPKIRTIESIPKDFHLDQRRLSQQYPSKSYSHYDAEINKSDMRHKNKTSSQPILDRSSGNRVENYLKSFNSVIPLNSSSRNNSPEVVSNRSEERAAISPVLCVGSEIGSSQQQSYNVASPRHAQLSTNDHFRFDNRMELADIDKRMGSHNKENYKVNKTISNTLQQYDSSLSKELQSLEQSLKQHSDTTVKNLTEYVLQNYRQDLQTVYDRWLEQFNKLECTLRRINPHHNVEGRYQKPDGFPL